MNMYGMSDVAVVMLFLLASLLVCVSDAKLSLLPAENATKLVGETFFFLCRDDEGQKVSWKGPKGALGPSTRPSVSVQSYGTSILFNNAVIEDGATYICSTKNEKRELHLTIAAPLEFKDTASNHTETEGKDVMLRCEVSGDGKVAWSLDGEDLTDKKKYRVLGDGLLIKNVTPTDSKTYVCKALQQSTGTVVDRKITLRVLHKPKFAYPTYAEQEVTWGYINGTVNLTCTVMADPPAKFEWLKNNDPKQKIGTIIVDNPNTSILQLHIDKSTFGNYKCVAKNKFGQLQKFFSLEQGTKPNPPKMVQLHKATSNTLKLLITSSDKNETKSKAWMKTRSFHVEFKKSDGDEWEFREFNITEDNSYPVDNLIRETEYNVRVAARNGAGLSDYTDISTFKTSQALSVHSTSQCNAAFVFTIIFLFQMYGCGLW